jgi:phosphoenolpyruvate synthase/pyruvate phosphate dikinase
MVTTGAPYEALDALGGDEPTSARISSDGILRGLGCSAGVAEGRVRIVRSPDDDLALGGHILVAPRTDPGWAPLFPSARAIVVERGSLLSHSAVLARELGIPAVVGVAGVVNFLRDGELVRIDGTEGTIQLLERP